MLRPDREIGYCFRVDARGNHIPVLNADHKSIRPGFQRLKSGDIGPVHSKQAAAERDARAEAFLHAIEEDGSEGEKRGTKRRWLFARDADYDSNAKKSRGRKKAKLAQTSKPVKKENGLSSGANAETFWRIEFRNDLVISLSTAFNRVCQLLKHSHIHTVVSAHTAKEDSKISRGALPSGILV